MLRRRTSAEETTLGVFDENIGVLVPLATTIEVHSWIEEGEGSPNGMSTSCSP